MAPNVAPTAAQVLIMTETQKPPTWPSWLVGGVALYGAPEGIRTPNLLIRSQMLYPLSYGRRCQTSVQTGPPRGGSGI